MNRVTRGNGLLENFLSKQRANIARTAISENFINGTNGKILDIGCGKEATFLESSNFGYKVGIDLNIDLKKAPNSSNIKLIKQDIKKLKSLNFSENFFDVITLLAVIEHIYEEEAIELLKETKRILKKNGILILTTPSRFIDTH